MVREYNKQAWLVAKKYSITVEEASINEVQAVLDKHAPGFTKSDPSYSSLVLKRGAVEPETFLIKSRIQHDILNPVQKLAAQGVWTEKWCCGHYDYGVKGYINEQYIEKILNNPSDKTLAIAKMLCFEAIALGVLASGKDDRTCLDEFITANLILVTKMLIYNPQYFVHNDIITYCMKQAHNELASPVTPPYYTSVDVVHGYEAKVNDNIDVDNDTDVVVTGNVVQIDG